MSAPIRPEDSPFPLRRSLGKLGRRTRVEANFFELRLPTKPLLYQLDVKIEPSKLPLQKRHEALEQLRVKNPNLKIYYDGTSIGATNTKFEGDAEMMTAEVILPSDSQDSKPIKITLKITATLSYAELANFLAGTQREIPKDYIKLLNMYLFHFAVHNPALATFPKSSSFFMLDGERASLPGRLDLLFGGFVSVRWSGVDLNMKPLNKMYANIDTVATAFYSKGPLLERWKLLIPNPNKNLSPREFDLVNKSLKTLKVQVTYRGPKSKRYTILGISKKSAAESSFIVEGKKRTVAQHFQIEYKIQLKYPNLPCVVVAGGPTGKIELPIEVCDVPNDIRYKGGLIGAQTSQIIKLTAARPNERKTKILKPLNMISAGLVDDNPWGLELSNKMTEVDARVLPPPNIQYGGTTKPVIPVEGIWNYPGLKFFQPMNLNHWAVIDFANDKATATGVIADFVKVAREKGMSISATPTLTPGNPNGDLAQILNKALAATSNCQIMVYILPHDNGLYPSLKKIADCDLGLPSQCLMYQKLRPNNGPYLTNVALKVNIKLGGVNHRLKDSLPMFDVPTLILGADVTHPGPGTGDPSIAAVVGSVSGQANSYIAKIGYQKSGQEYIDDFEKMAHHCILMFKKKAGRWPLRIIYYRDGVGEGMFKEVKRQEIAAMLKAFDQITKSNASNAAGPPYRPKITMVVVQKRHHARLFPMTANDMDKSKNAIAGTVVETGICHPSEFDFYLQSQAGLQGTSRPTHYHVLHDENGFTPDALHDLTNKMCYLQGRCTRSVRIVTVVYHADIVCYRARCHLIKDGWGQSSSGRDDLRPEEKAKKVSDKLEETMWWM